MGLMRPGDKGPRAQYEIGGQRYIRDGSRLRPYEQMANLGFDFEDPSLMDQNGSPVAGSLQYAQAMNRMALDRQNAYADRNWNAPVQDLGFKNWRQARRAMLEQARNKGLSDEDIEFLWKGGPGAWQDYGLIGKQPAQQPPPKPKPTAGLTPTNIVGKEPPAPVPNPAADTNPTLWGINNQNRQNPAVQPNRMNPQLPNQQPGMYTNKGRRPPVGGTQRGYMPRQQGVAQLGF